MTNILISIAGRLSLIAPVTAVEESMIFTTVTNANSIASKRLLSYFAKHQFGEQNRSG